MLISNSKRIFKNNFKKNYFKACGLRLNTNYRRTNGRTEAKVEIKCSFSFKGNQKLKKSLKTL